MTHALVVMGVSGVGKTTVAERLATALTATYLEADRFHPAENIAAMSEGRPLTDDMRQPWLDALGQEVAVLRARHPIQSVIVACSALKKSYRDILRAHLPSIQFIYLHGPYDVIQARLKSRKDHFMPPTLLDSQFATLEPPGLDENVISVSVEPSETEIIHHILTALRTIDVAPTPHNPSAGDSRAHP